MVDYLNIICLLYFAIKREFQGRGYGHEVLEIVKSMYPNHVYIADVEKDESGCINHDMRKKRELFYLHDDYVESNISYKFNGVTFIIMVANGTITLEKFKEFWSHFAFIDKFAKYIRDNL